ncbi:MAG: mechanosensitive ion channel family protein, partial [Alphaproteobacteria bacterium HGW-Alphaproteobacteria-8]
MKRLHVVLVLVAMLSFGFVLPAPAQEETAPALPPQVLSPGISVDELTLRLIPLTQEELAAAAAEWLAIVKAKTQEVVDAQIAVAALEGEAADAARERVAALALERKSLFDNYSTVLDSWGKKGGDAAAIGAFRAYRSAIVAEETRTADAETLAKQVLAWATAREGGVQLLIDVGVIAASLLGLLLVARMFRRFVFRVAGRARNLSKLLQVFIA